MSNMFKSKELVELMLLLILTCSYQQGIVEAFGPAVYLASNLPEQINRVRTNPTSSSSSSSSSEEIQEVDQFPYGGTRKYIFKEVDSEGRTVMPSQVSLDRLNQILEVVRLHLRPTIEQQLSEDQPEFGKRYSADWTSPGSLIVKQSPHRKPAEAKKLASPKGAWFVWKNDKDRARSTSSLNGSEEIPISSPMHSMNNRRWNREPSGGASSRWNNLRGMWGKRSSAGLPDRSNAVGVANDAADVEAAEKSSVVSDEERRQLLQQQQD